MVTNRKRCIVVRVHTHWTTLSYMDSYIVYRCKHVVLDNQHRPNILVVDHFVVDDNRHMDFQLNPPDTCTPVDDFVLHI